MLRRGRQTKVGLRDLALDRAGDAGGGGLVRAPMHGKVLAVLVEQGAQVARGQRVAIIEAMKMEHTLTAPIDGTVTEIAVAVGRTGRRRRQGPRRRARAAVASRGSYIFFLACLAGLAGSSSLVAAK